MQIRFWGTRGSIASPGAGTVRYGGNTSCVEVRTDSGTLIVLDCGTGASALGHALAKQEDGPRRGHVLISHTHWDHIQGVPFFRPLFVPGQEWEIYGPRDLGTSLQGTLSGQMQHTYFPVTLDALAANIRYHDLVEGSFDIGDVRVTARYLNHPALTLGYRIEGDGGTVVYATDHEPHLRELAYGRRGKLNKEAERHERFLEGADLLIHDAQYTASEYAEKEGWGHSTMEFVVDTACAAGVGRLALYHHDPQRTDDEVDEIVQRAAERASDAADGPDIFAAAEGATVVLRSTGVDSALRREPSSGSAEATPVQAGSRAVLLGPLRTEVHAIVSKALQADKVRTLTASDGDELLRVAAAEGPSLVILELNWEGQDTLALSRALSELEMPPTVVVAVEREGDVDMEAGAEAGVEDWLVPPLTDSYVRTRVRAWLMRVECRWQKAPLPSNEEARVRALHDLNVLDTEPEERFDRFTRIAAALFDVPVVLVCLIDANRQWFKSRHGVDVEETPRDLAFCAHAILGSDVLHVPDALADDRFADNPLVTGPPHLRFYAGVPLHIGNGHRAGTLCVIDQSVRQFSADQLQLLQDLGKLVERELVSER